MRLIIQRVSSASVSVAGETISAIDRGLLVLVGIETADASEDVDWLCSKVAQLRIFNDENGVPNSSLIDVNGQLLVVSQFTLHAAVKKGNRPSYIRAARPEAALVLFEEFVRKLNSLVPQPVQTGKFGADMQVILVNDGPHTIIIDSKNRE